MNENELVRAILDIGERIEALSQRTGKIREGTLRITEAVLLRFAENDSRFICAVMESENEAAAIARCASSLSEQMKKLKKTILSTDESEG